MQDEVIQINSTTIYVLRVWEGFANSQCDMHLCSSERAAYSWLCEAATQSGNGTVDGAEFDEWWDEAAERNEVHPDRGLIDPASTLEGLASAGLIVVVERDSTTRLLRA